MATDNRKLRLLIVEDDPPIQLLLQHLLRPRFEIALADTIDEALEMATRQHFDLFVIDINMGEQTRTGVELLEMLRQLPGYDVTPAIACTAFAGEAYRVYFLSHGFDGYVDKPFTRSMLLETVQETLVAPPLLEVS